MKKIIALIIVSVFASFIYSQNSIEEFKTNEVKRYWHNKISTDNYLNKCAKLGIMVADYTIIKKNKYYPIGFYVNFYNPTFKEITEIKISVCGYDIKGKKIMEQNVFAQELTCNGGLKSKEYGSWTFPNVWKCYDVNICQINKIIIYYSDGTIAAINDASEVTMSGVMLKWMHSAKYIDDRK